MTTTATRTSKQQQVCQAKQTVCTGITLLCTFLSRYCTTTTGKCLISRSTEDVNKRRRKFLSVLNLSAVPGNQLQGNYFIAYIRHLQRIGINATQFEKTLMHFKSIMGLSRFNMNSKLDFSEKQCFKRKIKAGLKRTYDK